MIGVIGGTFDPIHFGHLRPALEVTQALNLDEMRFIPSAKPPHRWQPEASSEDRLAMVKLAIQGVDKFVIDDREHQRFVDQNIDSFTVDTLASIRAEIGEEKPLCMMIGMDAFQSFTQWRDWQKILDLAHLVISHRPGYKAEIKEKWAQDRLVKSSDVLNNSSAGKLFLSEVTQLDISATEIRKQALKGNSLRYLTPKSVCDYIYEHKLYT
jgi:nicotinate-nucleotide adenylyltransferase